MKTGRMFLSHLYCQDQRRHKEMNGKYLLKECIYKQMGTIHVVFKPAIFM